MISAKIPNSKRKEVYQRDGYRCALCDRSDGLQIHHCIPKGQGGSDRIDNLITLCPYCHSLAHGVRTDFPAAYMNQLDVIQACVEYLADFYAPEWNP